MPFAPGVVRDAVIDYLAVLSRDASTEEIIAAVTRCIGSVSLSSVRTVLSLNTPEIFKKTGRGRYSLKNRSSPQMHLSFEQPFADIGQARLYQADCFHWMGSQKPRSIHAVVTDPPYGLVEYSAKETRKLRSGNGGVWRIPPSFDGHQRAPLPRFTTLSDAERLALHAFFLKFGSQISEIAVPGANVLIASNPLFAHIVANAMVQSGLELRGYIARQVMTMRGGDRPKNAHHEFDGVSVMPRSQWEPWIVLRTALEGRVQDNLRKWGTGGFRRPSDKRPFGDLIRSHPTPASEKKIAPHPSLKPQAFMRKIVRASLPLGKGVILDPFMGGGSTLAAANAIGYTSIGIELDQHFFQLANTAIPKLTAISVKEMDD